MPLLKNDEWKINYIRFQITGQTYNFFTHLFDILKLFQTRSF
ncbi:hypothetical protein [Spiroplasma endosymbiont of Panorpa germanica]